MSFELAFTQLVGIEGKYSDDENDPGNWTGGVVNQGELRGTMYGISAKAYPKIDIKSLTLSTAQALYRRDYWDKVKGDLLPNVVSVAVFKEAVNLGVEGAIKALQRSLKVDPDGDLGQVTVGIAANHPPLLTVKGFLTECAFEYTQMANWPKYGKGWLARIIQTALEAQFSSTELTPNAVKN